MSSVNGDFLYYVNGFLSVKRKEIYLGQTNKFKKFNNKCMDDEDDRTSDCQ
jgi:hypothetical protein